MLQALGQAAAAAEDHANQPLAALRHRMQQSAGQQALEGRLAAQGLEGRLLLLLGMLLVSAMAAATAGIVAPLVAGAFPERVLQLCLLLLRKVLVNSV